MPPRSFVPVDYWPSSPRSGNEGNLIFRMSNMILRGDEARPYAECYGGSLDLGETIATANLTGTAACTANSTAVVGTGTAFTTECHLGQFLEAFGGTNGAPTIPLVVDTITDDTHLTVCRASTVTSSGCTVIQLPRMFEVNQLRGTLLFGNAVMFDLRTILCVGAGTLRLNGAVLPGTSLTASRSPKIAIYNASTGNYSVYTLGMATPATLTAADQAGGAKNMQVGTYSIRACAARLATGGYNNPSPKAEVTLTVAGHMIRGTFPAADTTNGQDAWMIFVTLFIQPQSGVQGPWYRFEQATQTIMVTIGAGAGQIPAAGGTYDIDYNDYEVSGNDLLTFNNLAPPQAEFIGVVGGIPNWISCQGAGGLAPGPFIAPAKSANIEAAPSQTYVSPSPPDTIIGFHIAQGREYLLCVNTLQIAQATQTTDPRIPPLVVRPYWKSGFKNPDTLLFVDGYLIGMTNHGLARSLADGDEGSEEFSFAVALDEFLRTVSPGHCLIKLDPRNNAACLFHSGHSLNASGFWTTRVWMYGLRQSKWIGDVLLTSTTHDMLVSGAATVNGQLEFLAGGRTSGATTVVKTYRFDDTTAGESVPYYLAWQFGDWNVEDRPKRVGPYFSVVARQAAGGTAGIFGAEPGETVDVTALEAGTGSKSGAITLPVAAGVVQENQIELNVTNLKQFAVRVSGTWAGSGERDRIDEAIISAQVEGARR